MVNVIGDPGFAKDLIENVCGRADKSMLFNIFDGKTMTIKEIKGDIIFFDDGEGRNFQITISNKRKGVKNRCFVGDYNFSLVMPGGDLEEMDTGKFVCPKENTVPVRVMTENLEGKKVAVTGTLDYTRDHYINLIQKYGGTYHSTVNGNTSLLIAGYSCGSKLAKAKNLGIVIISADEFLSLYG